MSRQILVWIIGGVIVAGAAIALILSPSVKETPYDLAIDASRRFGVEADKHSRELEAMLATTAERGKGTPVCQKAWIALRQQRVAFKAVDALPGHDPQAVYSAREVEELRRLRETNLVKASAARRELCGGEEDDPA